MKTTNITYESITALKDNLNIENLDTTKSFIQVFSGFVLEEELQEICSILKERNKDIKFIGTTTAGEIVNGTVAQASITLSIMEFENTSFENRYFNNEDNYALGIDVASKLYKENTKVMILFIEGLLNNGSDVLDGISSVNSTIPIAGGMAGDNGAFVKTFVFDNDGVYENGLVAVTLNSDCLNVFTNYQLNWQAVGKYLTVTKAEKNRLYEIDGLNVSDVYRKYLGDRIGDGLPHSAIEFPLLKIEDNGLEVCRTFVHKFDEDGSLLTIGNLEVGDKVRLAFGNVNMILSNAQNDANRYTSFQPEAIYTYSCASRITFLQSDVVKELLPLNNIAPIAGFFTYGEIFHQNNKNTLLNISLTVLGLSENSNKKPQTTLSDSNESTHEKNFFNDKHFMVLDGLTTLSNVVMEELRESENEFKMQKEFVQTLLDSQEQLIITTDGKSIRTANKTFFDFFAVDTVEGFMQKYDAKCICDMFNTNAPEDYLQINMGEESWIDYVISRSFAHTHKAMISIGSRDFIFSVTAAKLPGVQGLKSAIFTDITAIEKAKQQIEAIHKQTRESIEYASLIQQALIPSQDSFKKYFDDFFTIWQPKDTVGGDIYLFEEIRDADECLLMVIDCTGHGVPGAICYYACKSYREATYSIYQ